MNVRLFYVLGLSLLLVTLAPQLGRADDGSSAANNQTDNQCADRLSFEIDTVRPDTTGARIENRDQFMERKNR
ncbi:MAG: hypothetical protein AAF556_04290, partial [Pseudomonadota bacterium]